MEEEWISKEDLKDEEEKKRRGEDLTRLNIKLINFIPVF
jgi:hypothetical protein